MKIIVTKGDDILYQDLISFLYDIKILHGGNYLAGELRKHSKLRQFLRTKQKERLDYLESHYFNSDGTLDEEACESLLSDQ